MGNLVFPLYAITPCHAQVGARLSLSVGQIDDTDLDPQDMPGFQVGVFKKIALNDYVHAIADLNFLSQYADLGPVTINYQSVNTGFAFRLYPTKQGFFVAGGVEGGFATRLAVDGENAKLDDKGRLGTILGIGYSVGKIDIETRYISTINAQPFSRYLQLGVYYTIK
ncbi:MAG: hypothetical protein ACK5QX_11835 [bacterium]